MFRFNGITPVWVLFIILTYTLQLDTTDPEEALTYLERKMYEIDRLNKIAEELEESVEQDNSAVLIMNSYTKHTMVSFLLNLNQ